MTIRTCSNCGAEVYYVPSSYEPGISYVSCEECGWTELVEGEEENEESEET